MQLSGMQGQPCPSYSVQIPASLWFQLEQAAALVDGTVEGEVVRRLELSLDASALDAMEGPDTSRMGGWW